MEQNDTKLDATKVEVKPNGPLVVHGKLAITDKDGSIILKDRRTSFCRCGVSTNQPFCDGSHKTITFEDN
ncbi:MAG: CDGSH-type Zn-finger protein [Flavobacteriaceae bacterium]|jgi:CDGSH-type Zn-finger protein|uniref:CDGSH iron-sulfur domain-containing protein n=1 Tax=Candidatus Marifrigoribacter sp. Uisw_064 TaxID=3230970 RepID=UPI003ADD1F3A